jgi:hypothetical protein
MASTDSQITQFTAAVLDQAQAVALAYGKDLAPRFAQTAGPHLRHVIEHYAALLSALAQQPVEYDRRARDREIEQNPALAAQQIAALRSALAHLSAAQLHAPCEVVGLIGLHGEHSVSAHSSLARELMFLASHTIHHLAILRPALERDGVQLPAELGKAPATLAHEREARRDEARPATQTTAAASSAPAQRKIKEASCPALN